MAPDERSEVADIILRFIDNRSRDPWEWGEYLSIRENDPQLEEIRLRCASIREEYPPSNPADYCSAEGIEVLRKIAEGLLSEG